MGGGVDARRSPSRAERRPYRWWRGSLALGSALFCACLSAADLSGVDLMDADLTGIDTTGAAHDTSTCWPQCFDPLQHRAVLAG